VAPGGPGAGRESEDPVPILCAFSITPLGGSASVSGPVADAVRIVRDSGLPNETNAMFTNIEGPWDEVMEVIRRCCQELAKDAPRVSLVMKVDYRQGARDAMRHKVDSVERRLADG